MSAVTEDLIRLGHELDIDEVLHYGAKPEHLALHLGKSGKILKVEHKEECPVRIPWPFSRTSDVRPNLLCDSAKYIGGPSSDRQRASRRLHHDWCSRAPDHPAVTAVRRFFDRDPENIDVSAKLQKLDRVLYFDKKPVCEYAELYDAIDQTLRAEHKFIPYPSRFDDADLCVLSTHGKVNLRGLDNAQALLGYNQDVTRNTRPAESERMLQAPMSYSNMRAYVGALTWLAQHRTLPTVNIKRGSTILWVGWTEGAHRIETVVDAVLRGPSKGTTMQEHRSWVQKYLDDDRDLLEEETPYHLLVLGCGSRIAVRGYHTMTVGTLARRLIAYLDDFSWPTSEGDVRSMAPPYTVLKLREPALHPTTSLVEAFGNSIFLGRPYPRVLERGALDAFTESVRDDEHGRPSILSQAVLSAIFNRRLREIDTRKTMSDALEKTIGHPNFILGRMFAVLEARNQGAKDKNDRTRVIRALPRAMRNPGPVVLDQLMVKATRHQVKIEGRGGGAYEQDLADLHSQLLESCAERGMVGPPKRAASFERQLFVQGRMFQQKVYRDGEHNRVEASKSQEGQEDDNTAHPEVPASGL